MHSVKWSSDQLYYSSLLLLLARVEREVHALEVEVSSAMIDLSPSDRKERQSPPSLLSLNWGAFCALKDPQFDRSPLPPLPLLLLLLLSHTQFYRERCWEVTVPLTHWLNCSHAHTRRRLLRGLHPSLSLLCLVSPSSLLRLQYLLHSFNIHRNWYYFHIHHFFAIDCLHLISLSCLQLSDSLSLPLINHLLSLCV